MPTATQGSMKTSSGVSLPLQHTDVQANVNGPIADVQVKQVFKNNTPEKIEATYSFPLSHEGSVCRFNFKLGDRIIQGVIKEKEEAKKTYEAAKARGQAATLLEQDKENLFTMSVANIQPDEVIEVNMGYQEKIPFDDGEYRFIFPLVATEAFDNANTTTSSSSAKEPSSAPTPTHSISASSQRSNQVNIKITIKSGVGIEPPKSLSHSIEVSQHNGVFEVQLSPTDAIPNRDFVIAYKLLSKEVEPVLYFEKPEQSQPGSFVLVVTPPPEVDSKTHAPLDVVFLVDRSFSMRGGSLAQCARALSYILEPLNDKDGVQLVLFDHDMESYDGSAEWRSCTRETKLAMTQFVEKAKPRGGTELELALHAAINVLPQRNQREKLICLLTDAAIGDLTRAQQLCELLVSKEHTRLYVLGVGPSVDRFAVQQLAKKALGVSEVLLATEKDISGTVSRFRRRLLEAGPAIQNLHLEWDKSSGLELYDLFPSSLPDLFTGQPLQLCGRYKGASSSKPVKITIKGDARDGSKFSTSKNVIFPDGEFKGNEGVQRTWAKFKIDSLTESLKDAQNKEEAKFDIISLSFQNVLMSKFTSFVAEEEDPNEKSLNIKVHRDKSTPVEINGLKGSDKAKSILLRAAIAFHTNYTGSTITVGDKEIRYTDNTTLINDLDLTKNVELLLKAASLQPITTHTTQHEAPKPQGFISRALSFFKKEERAPESLRTIEEKVASVKTLMAENIETMLSRAETLDSLEAAPSTTSCEPEVLCFDAPASPSYERSRDLLEETCAAPMSLLDVDFGDGETACEMEEEDCERKEEACKREECAPSPTHFAYPPPSPATHAAAPPPLLAAAPSASAPRFSAPPPRAIAPLSRKSSISSSTSTSSTSTSSTSSTSIDTRVLTESKKRESVWTPAIPWLSADKMDFLQDQAKMLPNKLVPTTSQVPEAYTKEDQEWVKDKKSIGEMDLAFVVDETGSMGSWIKKVQGEIHNIIDSIRSSPLCKDVRVGLVGYRDHPPQDQLVTEVMELTSDTTRIKRGVNEMMANGGGDGPECMTDGLYEAVRLQWRPTAARVVIVITDAPPHGLPSESGDGFPNGCPCGNHWYAQAACMREMGIVCYTVGCGISSTTETVYRTIANVTKGLYVNLANVSLLIPLITGAAETVLDRQRLQELLLEVVLGDLEALQRIEDEDALLAELLKRLRAKNIKLRALSVHANTMGMHYEDLTLQDVQLAFEDLRRTERVAL